MEDTGRLPSDMLEEPMERSELKRVQNFLLNMMEESVRKRGR